MKNQVSLDHVAIQCNDKEKALTFFGKLLHYSIVKTFTLSRALSKDIFLIDSDCEVLVFDGINCRFEVFISKRFNDPGYAHVCISVPNRREFIEACNQHGVEYFEVEKDGKTLLFARDFSNNLYEIKTA